MAITNTWSITKLDRITADGYVYTAHFQISTEDSPYRTSASGSVNLEKPDTLIPYSDLTEEIVLGWVKTVLDATETNTTGNIEAALADKLAEAKAPTRASGVPW